MGKVDVAGIATCAGRALVQKIIFAHAPFAAPFCINNGPAKKYHRPSKLFFDKNNMFIKCKGKISPDVLLGERHNPAIIDL